MTVYCFNLLNLHAFKVPVLQEHHELRYEIFGNRGWNISSIENREYDQYDTIEATYFLSRNDNNGVVEGVLRASPTNVPYMIKEFFPDMYTESELPNSEETLELTRYGISEDLSAQRQKEVNFELTAAIFDFGVRYKKEKYISITPDFFIRRLGQMGGKVKMRGNGRTFDGRMHHAVDHEVSRTVVNELKRRGGIKNGYLIYAEDVLKKKKERKRDYIREEAPITMDILPQVAAMEENFHSYVRS